MFNLSEKIEHDVLAYFDSAKHLPSATNDHLIGSGAIAELEWKIADLYAAKHVVCTSSGSSSLLAIALAMGLKDSQFITSPLTYGASLASWLILGNQPVFVDVDPQTLTLDPSKVSESITPDIRAILAVDIFGNPCDSGALRQVADEFGIAYVGDNCQALGATRGHRAASYAADAIAISFTVGKSITCGEGGAIITNDSALYERVMWWSQHPLRQKRDIGLHKFNEFAFNARIHPLGAVWANAVFEESLDELRRNQARYQKAISILNESGLIEPINFDAADIRPSFFQLTVALTEGASVPEILEYLTVSGLNASASRMCLGVVYKNHAFLQHYADRYQLPLTCHVAERAAEKRIVLTVTEKDG